MFFVSIIIGAVTGGFLGGILVANESSINHELTQIAWAFMGIVVSIIIYSEISHYIHYGIM